MMILIGVLSSISWRTGNPGMSAVSPTLGPGDSPTSSTHYSYGCLGHHTCAHKPRKFSGLCGLFGCFHRNITPVDPLADRSSCGFAGHGPRCRRGRSGKISRGAALRLAPSLSKDPPLARNAFIIIIINVLSKTLRTSYDVRLKCNPTLYISKIWRLRGIFQVLLAIVFGRVARAKADDGDSVW